MDESSIGKGIEMDSEQIGIEWLPLEGLSSYDFYPKAIVPHLIKYGISHGNNQIYMGDMG